MEAGESQAGTFDSFLKRKTVLLIGPIKRLPFAFGGINFYSIISRDQNNPKRAELYHAASEKVDLLFW